MTSVPSPKFQIIVVDGVGGSAEIVVSSASEVMQKDIGCGKQLFFIELVLIPKLGSLRITVEGDEYFICKEQDVYAKFGEKTSVIDVLKETVVDELFETVNKIN